MVARGRGGRQSGTSPWVWVGCGCVLLAFLVAAALIGGGFFAVNKGREMVETMADPTARQGKAAEILGAASLPDGYHATVALDIPFLFQLVMLSDGTPPEETTDPDADLETKAESMENLVVRAEDLGDHLFVFMRMRGRTDETIEDVLSGRERVQVSSGDLNFDFEIEEPLGEGRFEDGQTTIDWRSQRGTLGLTRGRMPAVWATLDVTCRDGARPMGLWVRRLDDPDEANEAETTAAEATAAEASGVLTLDIADAAPADPAQLEAFVQLFDFCAG